MKFGILLAILVPMMASAQGTRPAAPRAPAQSYSSSDTNNIGAGLGFVRGAANFGFDYERRMNELGFGGYFFMQTKKEKNNTPLVQEFFSFGGQVKAHVLSTNRLEAYLAPGFGIHMIKDVVDETDKNAKKSDVTTFGPTLSIGVAFNLTPQVRLGLDRFELWNWFDDKAPSLGAAYRVMAGFTF